MLGAVSTFGDWLWTHYIPDGAVVPGILHGVVVFLVIGLFLASQAVRAGGLPGRARQLTWGLPVAGAVIAAAFYPLYGLIDALGYSAYYGYLVSLLVTDGRRAGGELIRAHVAASGGHATCLRGDH
ncbi:MAG: hypothetical protein AAFX50_25875, partial [Acidobacteriota bacterium]